MMGICAVVLSILLLATSATGKRTSIGNSKFLCQLIYKNSDECDKNFQLLNGRQNHHFNELKKNVVEDEIPLVLCKGKCLRNRQDNRKRSKQNQKHPHEDIKFYSGW